MVTRIVLVFVLVAVGAVSQPAVMDNRAVVEMVEKGVSEELILEAIRSAPEARFRFTTDDYAEFTRVKVGPVILRAMYERQTRGGSAPAAKAAAPKREAPKTVQAAPAEPLARFEVGPNELAVGGSIQVPHFDASATNGYAAFGYQRYLKPWLSVGPGVGAVFFGSQIRNVDAMGVVQFVPRLGDRVALLTGVGAGVNHWAAGVSDTNFLMTAYAGPRMFVNRNVAFDVVYRFRWRRVPGAGFSGQTASGVNFGLSFFF